MLNFIIKKNDKKINSLDSVIFIFRNWRKILRLAGGDVGYGSSKGRYGSSSEGGSMIFYEAITVRMDEVV